MSMVPRPRFELRFPVPKTGVLPLDEQGKAEDIGFEPMVDFSTVS